MQGQVGRLQGDFLQYKKGEFLDLDLDLSQSPRAGPRRGLCLGLELAGPEAGLVLELGALRW